MPPEFQNLINGWMAFGGALLVLWGLTAICAVGWLGFASVLMLRGAVLAWRWMGVAEARVRVHERAGRVGHTGAWRTALVMVYVSGVGLATSIGLLALGQVSGWIGLVISLLVLAIPLGMAIFDI